MKSIYEELDIKTYVNAFGPFTVYGGSRMSERTIRAMISAGQSFVEIKELQKKVGESIAKLTNNEAAYVTTGASAGITLTTAVLIAGDDAERFNALPHQTDHPQNVVVLNCQKSIFWEPIRTAGAILNQVGTIQGTSAEEIANAINSDTAAIVYYMGTHLTKNAPPLEEVIKVANRLNVPIIVDSASFLPPASNLWKFTGMGADIAIFSGGKAIAGPQGSGLIVGKEYIIERCLRYGYPNMGLNRGCKIGKEEIAGYYEALKQFLETDSEQENKELSRKCQVIADVLNETDLFDVRIDEKGSIGQDIPTVFGNIKGNFTPDDFRSRMHDNGVFVGAKDDYVYLSPFFVKSEELETVVNAVRKSAAVLK